MSQVMTLSGPQSLELFDAIEQSDFGKVWRLVKAGRGLQGEDPESGLTPLALAAELGHTEVVRILLENEVDPNCGGSVTPLEAAVLEGNPEIVDLLIEAGADVNRPVEEGFTPLMSAVTMGNARIARQLLDAGAKTRLKNTDGDTAVDLAEAAGFEKLADLLRKHKPKPRPVPEEFLRPLELPRSKQESEQRAPANDTGSPSQPKWIQPDIEQVAANLDSFKTQPQASSSSSDSDSNSSSEAQDSESRMSSALFAGRKASAEDAEDAEDSASADDSEAAQTPELAGIDKFQALLVVDEFEEALSMFAQGLVGVEERDRTGRTALMLAAEKGAEDLVEALVATGADVKARDDSETNDTALVLAIRHEGPARKSIVRRLVEAGADLETKHGPKGLTPLMEAAKVDVYGNVGSPVDFAPVTKLLIEMGADLEGQDAQGNTVWQMIKRSAMAALTSSPYRRRLHQMLKVLESVGSKQMAGRI